MIILKILAKEGRKIRILRKMVIAVLAALMVVICFTTVQAAADDVVIDENLNQALINLGKDSDGNKKLSQDEIAALSGELDFSSKDIRNLTGLEFATGIDGINLSDNMVRDIGPIKELSITSLDISQNYLDLTDGSQAIIDIQALEAAGCTVTYGDQKNIPVDGVSLQQENVDLIVGGTQQLTHVIVPDDAKNQSVSWSSSDEGIVTVADGLVTAVGAGNADITVTTDDGGHTAQCSVSVTQPVESVTINESVDMCKGETFQLTTEVQPPNASNKNVSYTSSNTSVATVTNDGLVTSVGLGSAKITVTTEDEGFSKQCSINVVPDIISSSKYSIYMDKLWFAMESTSVSELIDELNNDSKYLSVHKADGSLYTGESVGTGMTVRLTVGGNIKNEIVILTKGDANGDGKVSIADYTLQRLHILDLKKLIGPYVIAADLSLNGTITITDYTTTRLHILGLHSIAESYTPVNPGESVDPTNPNDPGYLNTISNPRIRQFLEIALAQQGDPYISGHEGPNSYDCSGLVHYCLRETGFTWVYRATAVTYSDFFKVTDDPYDWDWIDDLDAVNQDPDDWRWPWIFVSAEDMQPGDLMFYEKDTDNVAAYKQKPVGHVGIYLGNGYHIHASSDYGQVIIGRFEGWYEEWFRFARRVNW